MSYCIYCNEELKENARFCIHCNHFQTKWKNWVPHIGGAIALLIFIGSIASFIIKPARDYYKKITWKDKIEVVYFSSNSGITVKNFGDGDVFLETVTYKIDDKYKKHFSGANPILTPAEKLKFTTYNIKSSTFGNVVTKTQKLKDSDVEPVFCKTNDPAFNTFQTSLKDKMLTFTCEAKLNYYSLNSNNKQGVDIPCVAYLLTKKSANQANSADAKNRAAD